MLVKTPVVFEPLRTFSRVLRISSKHSKIGKYKSCLTFQQTQFSQLVAFRILCGNCSKTESKRLWTVFGTKKSGNLARRSREVEAIKPLSPFAITVASDLLYNIGIYSFWSAHRKFGENFVGSGVDRVEPRSAHRPAPTRAAGCPPARTPRPPRVRVVNLERAHGPILNWTPRRPTCARPLLCRAVHATVPPLPRQPNRSVPTSRLCLRGEVKDPLVTLLTL
jgi:hypothetical protein